MMVKLFGPVRVHGVHLGLRTELTRDSIICWVSFVGRVPESDAGTQVIASGQLLGSLGTKPTSSTVGRVYRALYSETAN